MTDDKIAPRALLKKGSDTGFARDMIGFAARRLMEMETDTLCGAGHGERNGRRRGRLSTGNNCTDGAFCADQASTPGAMVTAHGANDH
jgi:hypothetical protein